MATLDSLKETPPERNFKIMRDTRTSKLVAVASPRDISPFYVDIEETGPIQGKDLEDETEEESSASDLDEKFTTEEDRYNDYLKRRIWLHGSEDEKADYNTLKAKFKNE